MRTWLHLDLHLLDRQVVDVDGEPVARVDDVELTLDENGELELTGLLVGPEALGARMGGRLGQWMADVGRRLRPDLADTPRIPVADVAEVTPFVTLTVHRDDLDFPRSEAWFRQRFIGRLPGGEHR